MIPFQEWSLIQLDKVLSTLKKKKSCDPYGLVGEMFRPEIIGSDLKLALLRLFNKIKVDLKIPELLHLAYIITITKGR